MEITHGTIGSSSNLTCAAHSQPPPVFEWFRERALLGNSKIYRLINKKWKSILQVSIKDSSVFGSYQCVVSNNMGEIKRIINLIEGIHPDPPSLKVRSDEPGVLKMNFLPPPPIEFLPILGYRIEWKLSSEKDWYQARYRQASEGDEFIIQDLSLESDYSIRIAVRNVVGYSNYSNIIVQRTKGLLAETVVDGYSLSSLNSSSTSSKITSASINGFPLSFYIFILLRFLFLQSC
nr:neural cell adhesion molecule 1-like [Parasteatoda tepidariorum]